MKKIFFLLFLATFISCKKDEIIETTQAQVTASKLSTETGVAEGATNTTNYQITVFNAANSSVFLNYGVSFRITSDGFISITSGSGSSTTVTTFNLGQLKSYQIFHFTGITDLDLYF